ncbi:MICOS complex subunit mic25-like [Pristis pectinata]|uniref:MICOS complex subunit mic25-like n=1 Tax=Pristis pectinata TaxID=685728 RepID=UPI00223E2338|nr:MICOS complex subunit mic25-like [Pristis pectinata]
MGASGSTRRVSFGVDGQQRVTVLQGLRLSDNLITRMKDLPQPMSKPSSSISAGSDPQWEGSMALNSGTKEELYQRYEKDKVMVEDELSKLAQQEQVEAITEFSERATSAGEQQDIKQLASQLERKQAELQELEAFYKEQLDLIEQKNAEYYRLASAQFNEAATTADTRVKRRNYEPLCINLQSQILQCYQENPQLTLKCSDFAKEYRHCIREAQKTLLVNQG